MRLVSTLALALSVAALAAVAVARPAAACTCVDPSHADALAASAVAGIGTVIAVELAGAPPAWPARGVAAARPACDWTAPTDRATGCIAGAVIDGAEPVAFGVLEIEEDDRQPPRAARTATFQGGCVRMCWLMPGPLALRLGSLERTVGRDVTVAPGQTVDVSVDLDGVTGPLLGRGRALIAIEEPWRGACAGEPVWVDFDTDEAACGYGGLAAGLGQRYAIYASRAPGGGGLEVGRCSGTHRLGDRVASELTRPPITRTPACQHAGGPATPGGAGAGAGVARPGGCGHCDAAGGPGLGALLLALASGCVVARRRRALPSRPC